MQGYRHWIILAIFFVAVSVVFTGCAPKSLVSTSQEISIGNAAAKDVEKQYKVDSDPKLNELVNDIGQNLVRFSDRQDIKYTFKVLDVKDVNAFSLPGGFVYVNKGLIDATKGNRDQLAGVMAHEIGHVAARHHADIIGRQTYASILVGTLTKGDTQQVASVFANVEMLHWSRAHEYQADRLGILYMYRSKIYDPEGLIDFFGNLLKIEGHAPSQFEQIFRTHPVTSDRIVKAKQYLADLKSGKEKP